MHTTLSLTQTPALVRERRIYAKRRARSDLTLALESHGPSNYYVYLWFAYTRRARRGAIIPVNRTITTFTCTHASIPEAYSGGVDPTLWTNNT